MELSTSMLSGAIRGLASRVGLDAEAIESVQDALDPRFFFLVNSTGTNTMSYFLSGLSILALFGLLLIIVFFLIGVVNDTGLNRRNDYEDTYTTYAGQGVDGYQEAAFRNAGPLQSRKLFSGYDAINVLYLLEDAFQKLELSDPGCQQRVICEAHEANAEYKYGAVAGKLQKIIGSLDVKTTADMNQEASGVFNMFRNAAIRGIQQQDCQEVYSPKCSKGLRELVRDSTKL